VITFLFPVFILAKLLKKVDLADAVTDAFLPSDESKKRTLRSTPTAPTGTIQVRVWWSLVHR
jgi:hypothetical protein